MLFANLRERIAPPQLIEIEPTLGCNLRCVMCHVPTVKEKTQFLDLAVLERQTEGLVDLHVIVGSEFEPTIHPNFDKFLRLAIKRRWKLDFLTNGTNLGRYDQALLSDVDFHVFNVSFDGQTKENFEASRRGANYERVLENIQRAVEIARKNGAYTAVNATVMRSNLEETPDLVRMWDRRGFDLVRLLIAQVRAIKDEVLAQSLYPILDRTKSVLNRVAMVIADEKLRVGVRCGYYGSPEFMAPAGSIVREATVSSDNPNHRHVPGVRQDVQSGHWPGMTFACKSPFVYARIRWDGGVDLCNKRDFIIGNLRDESFTQLWNGPAARSLRRKIKQSVEICEGCDYFRFCINIRHLDIEAPTGHFADGVMQDERTRKWLSTATALPM